MEAERSIVVKLYDMGLQYCPYLIGDLINFLNPLEKYHLYFSQRSNAFGY